MSQFEKSGSAYVQINEGGIVSPDVNSFPSITERIGQDPDPYKPDFTDYDVQRTTVQWTDNCNLACPGCYAKPWLPHGGEVRDQNARTVQPEEEFTDIVTAHGPDLKQVYFLGLEPTLRPQDTARRMKAVHDLGLTSVAATNGARGPKAFEQTFGDALETGKLERINISLDSMDADVHNRLRGRKYAHAKTMETIAHAVETDVAFQVTMTVWADNYHTVIDSVKELYDIGVRGFVFHEGSLEGAADYKDGTTRRIKPFEWRALTSQLETLKDEFITKEDMLHFVFPYIYFTEKELRQNVIGDDALTDAYLTHVDDMEAGKDTKLPFIACPGVDVPQVYVFANDGEKSAGAVSLCNMHTIQTGKYLAEYDPDEKRFNTEMDPDKNQMQDMIDSPNLCPAREAVMRDGNTSDRYSTPDGDVFHACRYISSNQMPAPDRTFGAEYYETFRKYYETRWTCIRTDATSMAFCDRIDALEIDYASKTQLLQEFIKSE